LEPAAAFGFFFAGAFFADGVFFAGGLAAAFALAFLWYLPEFLLDRAILFAFDQRTRSNTPERLRASEDFGATGSSIFSFKIIPAGMYLGGGF
jgi:hypothetical protein